MGQQKKYSDQEVQFLKQHAGILSGPEISRHLGRNYGSVSDKSRKIGISLQLYGNYHHKTVITDEEVELIRQLSESGMSYREISEKFETSPHYVYEIVSFRKRQGRIFD